LLVTHSPVALNADHQAVVAAARKPLGYYGRLPFYRWLIASDNFNLRESPVRWRERNCRCAPAQRLYLEGVWKAILLIINHADGKQGKARLTLTSPLLKSPLGHSLYYNQW
jgi:hypothetical protein